MGIDDLWLLLEKKGCKHEIAGVKLRDMIKGETCRIAVDAFHLCFTYFFIKWKDVMKNGRYDIERIYGECAGMVSGLSNRFAKEGMSIVLCCDGNKSAAKTASNKRTRDREIKYRITMEVYMTCKKLAYEIQLRSRATAKLEAVASLLELVKSFAFLEDYIYVLPPQKQTIDGTPSDRNVAELCVELRDATDRLRKLIESTVFLPSGFVKRILDIVASRGIEVCHIPSISEGEKLCSILVSLGYCQAIYSGDCDSIVFGTRCVIRSIKDSKMEVYFYRDVLRKFQMNDEQFLGMCIGMGSDFNDRIYGMGPEKCLKRALKDDFNIHEFNLENCGALLVNIGIQAFRITSTEMRNVRDQIEFYE